MGFGGIVVLMGPWAIHWGSGRTLIGNAFLLGAALSWGLAIITVRRAPPRSSMFELLPWCFLVGAVALAPLVAWEAPHGSLGTQPGAWAALAYIGLLAGPLGSGG